VTKYVLPEDQDEYGDFCFHHLKRLATVRKFSPLIHYTSGANLINIVNSGELWATQIGCLNDAKEILHSVELLKHAIEEHEKTGPDEKFAILLAKMRALLSEPNPENAGMFVVCFSERRDDLSQWRAYGGPDGGYAIEFEIEKLLEATKNKGGYLVPVTYDMDAKTILLADIIKWTEIFFLRGIEKNRAPTLEDWIDEFAPCWLDHLSWLAPLLKHPAFKDEVEWRFIYSLKSEDFENLRFTERKSMMTRHIPVNFSAPNAKKYTPLPISSVVVGPKVQQRLSQVAVGDLLKSKGYADTVSVTLSDIPFRTAH